MAVMVAKVAKAQGLASLDNKFHYMCCNFLRTESTTPSDHCTLHLCRHKDYCCNSTLHLQQVK